MNRKNLLFHGNETPDIFLGLTDSETILCIILSPDILQNICYSNSLIILLSLKTDLSNTKVCCLVLLRIS